MTAPAGLPAELFTPTGAELDRAHAQIDQLAGGGYAATYGAFGAVAAGQAGAAIRALRSGDVEAAAAILRRLAAADLAAQELRDRLVEETTVAEGGPNPALGGLDELVYRARAAAVDPGRDPAERTRAAVTADSVERTIYVLTGKRLNGDHQ